MKRIIALVLVLSIFSLTSCSLFSPSHQNINIIPSNPRADVYVDENFVGKGPQTVRMKKSSEHSIMAKCGESAGVGLVTQDLSATGFIDIIGGCLFLIPFIGLFAPGASKLTPQTISIAVPAGSGC